MRNLSFRCLVGAWLLCAAPAALTAQVLLGFCDDQIATKGQGVGSASNRVHAAMRLTSGQYYPSCQIAALYVGLSQVDGLTSLRAWVTTGLGEGDTLASVDVAPEALQVGWNVVNLPQTLSTAGRDTLYFGYTYTQTQRIYPISYSGTRGADGSFWIGLDSRWVDYSTRFAPVSIRVALQAAHAHDVSFLSARLDRRVVASGDTLTIDGQLQNLGSETLHSFAVRYDAAGREGQADYECTVPFGQQAAFRLQVPTAGSEGCDQPVVLTIDRPNGATDALPDDNGRTLYYDVLRPAADADAAVLVEEYTSLRNGYAPLGHARLDAAVARLAGQAADSTDGPALIRLSRHEGYGPDDGLRVTSAADGGALLFGRDGLTFVPAVAVDRYRTAAHPALAFADGVAVSTLADPDSLAAFIDEARRRPRYASLACTATERVGEGHWRLVFQLACASPALLADARVTAVVVQDTLLAADAKNYYPDESDGLVQADVVVAYVEPDEGADVFPAALLDDLQSGNARAGSGLTDNALTGRRDVVGCYTFDVTLPARVPPDRQCSLVVYVADRGTRAPIHAAARSPLDR